MTPKTKLLMTPLMMSSRKSTEACICDQNEPSSTPISFTPTSSRRRYPSPRTRRQQRHRPPRRPRSAARPRGRSGLTAIISIAESCSVAFIRPISAVMALPRGWRRAARTPPVPARATATGIPGLRAPSAEPVTLQGIVALQAQHHADEQAGHQDDDEAQGAGEINLAYGQVEAAQGSPGVHQDIRKKRLAKPSRHARPVTRLPRSVSTSASLLATTSIPWPTGHDFCARKTLMWGSGKAPAIDSPQTN